MNPLIQYALPQWMSVLFLVVIPIPVILIAFVAQKAAVEKNKTRLFYGIIAVLLAYFTLVSLAAVNGLFAKAFFPPTVLLYTTVPYAFFLFMIIYNLKGYKMIFEKLQLTDLVMLHIFRLVGVFFLLLTYYDTLPKTFALMAGLGDMITAITSVFVVKAIKSNKPYAKKLVYVWNTFGLADILFTAIAANVLTKISIDTGAMGVDVLAQFPYCLIPAFAPPTIIFLHVAIYRKIKNSFS